MYPANYMYSRDHEWIRVDDDVCTLGRELEAASHDLVRGADHPAEVQDPHDQRRHGPQRTCAIQSVAPVKERTSRRFRYRSPASSP